MLPQTDGNRRPLLVVQTRSPCSRVASLQDGRASPPSAKREMQHFPKVSCLGHSIMTRPPMMNCTGLLYTEKPGMQTCA